MAEDLWAANIADSNLITPVSILKEQAALLGEKTKHLVEAEVETHASGDKFAHVFYIVAPTLNYRYELFSVQHGIAFYPLTLQWAAEPLPRKLSDESSFKESLKNILSSRHTLNVVHSILAQVRA